MKKRTLIKQLKSLRDLEPRESWKNEARLVLLQQIGVKAEKIENPRVGLFDRTLDYVDFVRFGTLRFFKKMIMQPVGVGALVLAVILSSGSFAVNASLDSLPGDTFYSLKRTTEKMQLVLTRDQERKTKLALEFANRRLNEITEIQAKPTVNAVQKQAKVDQAIKTFHEQMEDVKTQIKQLEENKKDAPTTKKDDQNTAAELMKPIQEHVLYTERKLIEVDEQKKKAEIKKAEEALTDEDEEEKIGNGEELIDDEENEDESIEQAGDEEQETIENLDPLQGAKQALTETKNSLDKKDLNAALEALNNSQNIVNTALKQDEQPVAVGETELTDVNDPMTNTEETETNGESTEDDNLGSSEDLETDVSAEEAIKDEGKQAEETAVEDEVAADEAQ